MLWFLETSQSADTNQGASKPDWMTASAFNLLSNMKTLFVPLEEASNVVSEQPDLFKNWIGSYKPEESTILEELNNEDINEFHIKTLFLKIFRPDRLHCALTRWCQKNLSGYFDKNISESMFKMLDSVNCSRPVLLLKDTSNVHPEDIIQEYAKVAQSFYEMKTSLVEIPFIVMLGNFFLF